MKIDFQNEKLEIQRLKNKYARMKVEQQIADLQNKPAKKKGGNVKTNNTQSFFLYFRDWWGVKWKNNGFKNGFGNDSETKCRGRCIFYRLVTISDVIWALKKHRN